MQPSRHSVWHEQHVRGDNDPRGTEHVMHWNRPRAVQVHLVVTAFRESFGKVQGRGEHDGEQDKQEQLADGDRCESTGWMPSGRTA